MRDLENTNLIVLLREYASLVIRDSVAKVMKEI